LAAIYSEQGCEKKARFEVEKIKKFNLPSSEAAMQMLQYKDQAVL
jgi:hypothetical protein